MILAKFLLISLLYKNLFITLNASEFKVYIEIKGFEYIFKIVLKILFKRSERRGDLLRFVPNIKNGVEIKFHCDSDSLGQMWLIGIGR